MNLWFIMLLNNMWTEGAQVSNYKPGYQWHSKVDFLSVFTDLSTVDSQRLTVKLWPQLWSPAPPIWQSWTWVATTCRIQEWSCCRLDCRVQTVDWRLWGQFMCFTHVQCSSTKFKSITEGLNSLQFSSQITTTVLKYVSVDSSEFILNLRKLLALSFSVLRN